MHYKRMPIEKESPEETGYENILYNLAESSMTDLTIGALNLILDELPLGYIAHRGKEPLREMIASETEGIHKEDVLLTHGAAGALFIIHSALLTPQDHLIVVRPNYATNIEVPVTIGSSIDFIDLDFEHNWRVPVTAINAAITPRTKLISITTPHNPTGMVMSREELNELIAIAEKNHVYLLVDETYRDACFKTPYPLLAAQSPRVISVSSLSKAYGLPGIRMGWIITKDQACMEQFLAAKEMIYISNSALDEEVAWGFYRQKEKLAAVIREKAYQNFETLRKWLQRERRLECILPQGGVVCFPRVKDPGMVDTKKFYHILLQQYKTMVGPGHWFAMPDHYMRIGFGWGDKAGFEKALEQVSLAISDSLRKAEP